MPDRDSGADKRVYSTLRPRAIRLRIEFPVVPGSLPKNLCAYNKPNHERHSVESRVGSIVCRDL